MHSVQGVAFISMLVGLLLPPLDKRFPCYHGYYQDAMAKCHAVLTRQHSDQQAIPPRLAIVPSKTSGQGPRGEEACPGV